MIRITDTIAIEDGTFVRSSGAQNVNTDLRKRPQDWGRFGRAR